MRPKLLCWLALLASATGAHSADFDKIATKVLIGAAKTAVKAKSQANRPDMGHPLEPRSVDYVVETSDRWKLVLHRRFVPGLVHPHRPPVILCHGFGYNSRFFDIPRTQGLADYLSQAGFDVWSVDLRGCGQSHKWALSAKDGGDALIGRITDKLSRTEIPKRGFVNVDPKFYKWTLDDHVEQDIPAILSFVKHQTGAPRVAWLGHSMGGNILLAYFARFGQDPSVERVCTVGSQLTMPEGQLFVQFLVEMMKQRQSEIAGRQVSMEEVLRSGNGLFFNESNTAPTTVKFLLTEGQDTPSVGLIQQYMTLSQSGRLLDAKKSFDYYANIRRLTCPILIVGGSVDQIAPPRAQRELYDAVGSQDRTLLTLGVRSGLSTDYGHCDALVGKRSAEEVYPLLARWLAGYPLGPAAANPQRPPRPRR